MKPWHNCSVCGTSSADYPDCPTCGTRYLTSEEDLMPTYYEEEHIDWRGFVVYLIDHGHVSTQQMVYYLLRYMSQAQVKEALDRGLTPDTLRSLENDDLKQTTTL